MKTILDQIWERMVRELKAYLANRHHPSLPHTEIKEGDIVLILEHKIRGHWPLGRVVKALPNHQDGRSRVFEVRVGNKTFIKALNHLQLLTQA